MNDVIRNIYEPEEGEIQNLKESKRKGKGKFPKIVKIENKSKQICKYWMNGRCEKGDTCSFSHAENPDKISEQFKAEKICKYELRGGCLNENCLFSHDKFFHLYRGCKARSTCRFSHEPMDQEMLEKLSDEWKEYKDMKSEQS